MSNWQHSSLLHHNAAHGWKMSVLRRLEAPIHISKGSVFYIIRKYYMVWCMVWYMKQPVDIIPYLPIIPKPKPYHIFASHAQTIRIKPNEAHSQSDFMYTSFCFWHEKQIVAFIVWNHVVNVVLEVWLCFSPFQVSQYTYIVVLSSYSTYNIYIFIFRCFRLRWECVSCCSVFIFLRLIEVKCSRVICTIRMVNIICLLLLLVEKPAEFDFAKYRHELPEHLSINVKRKQEWRKGCSLNMHVETETNR